MNAHSSRSTPSAINVGARPNPDHCDDHSHLVDAHEDTPRRANAPGAVSRVLATKGLSDAQWVLAQGTVKKAEDYLDHFGRETVEIASRRALQPDYVKLMRRLSHDALPGIRS